MGIVDKYSLKYFLRLVCGNLCYVMLLFKNTPLHPICTTYDLKSPLRCPGTCLPLLCCPEKMATLWQGYGVETWVVSPPTNPNCTCYMLVEDTRSCSPLSCSIFSSILNIRNSYILYKKFSDRRTNDFITKHLKFRIIPLNVIN